MTSINTPSFLEIILPVYSIGNIIRDTARRIHKCGKKSMALSGINRAAKPSIRKILNTFDPRTFPTAISCSFL